MKVSHCILHNLKTENIHFSEGAYVSFTSGSRLTGNGHLNIFTCVVSPAVSMGPRRQTNKGEFLAFGIGFVKAPVCNSQLTEEFPAVVMVREPSLILTQAVSMLWSLPLFLFSGGLLPSTPSSGQQGQVTLCHQETEVCKVPGGVTFTETESRMVVARGCSGRNGSLSLMGRKFPLGKMKNFWRWMVMSQNHLLKNWFKQYIFHSIVLIIIK